MKGKVHRRDKQVAFAVNVEELYSIDMFCKSHKIPRSIWIRNVIMDAIEKEYDKETKEFD